MSNLTELVQQLAQQQVTLQQQVNRMAEALTRNQTPAPAAVAASATPTTTSSSQKSSTAKPEPFVGKATDVRRFLSYFLNWASKQNDLPEESDVILSALSYMQGDAADWASRFIDQAMKSKQTNSEAKFPFEGKWDTFVQEFKTRFGSLDEEAEARKEIKGMKQGQRTVAQFAQKFQDVGSRTGFSDTDLMERFCNGLSQTIQLQMININIAQGKPKSLSDAVSRACTIELALHDPSLNIRTSAVSDPMAMDIDANRVGNGGRGGGNWNGKTRDDFLKEMRGRCFGCRSPNHV
ncbi:hypothetical protein VKT23_013765 [Stygiomarasmius scandens]|uniref:Retrotransposon gag domain-containing protein n=1 Tax=Marasmiellus scandens TaxID=2682957 RepID=A0ABR1J2G6_9AGAR